jgi:hypothetical protein
MRRQRGQQQRVQQSARYFRLVCLAPELPERMAFPASFPEPPGDYL